LPKGTKTYVNILKNNVVDINKDEIPQNKIEILKGKAIISNLKIQPHKIDFILKADSFLQVQANVDNFPGWQVKVNGRNVDIDDNNKLKLITFNVDKGESNINIEFNNTPIRTYANTISISSVIILLVFIFKNGRSPKYIRH